MSTVWTIDDFELWDDRIREKVLEYGLDCYPQEFELCDHQTMIGYMAYSGMPSRYPHWSYGKAYERLKTLYDYGVSGLPYEMVINSNPALAYLMQDNSLLLQILTIAHVYGHNDFFKNNFTFRTTNAEYVIGGFKARAARIRRYCEDPSIGLEKVETFLDAAHALSLQCQRNMAVRRLSQDELENQTLEAAMPKSDMFQNIHRRQEYQEPDLKKMPLEPDENILLFIRDHNPFLEDWERDVLTIVHEEAQYFIPQIETKIMNEGWATFWHKHIFESLNVSQDLHLEFLVRHSQVIRPHHNGINPYHVGLKIWEDIERRYNETPALDRKEKLGTPSMTGKEKIFEVRESDRDSAFIRRHLTDDLIRELDLFEYEPFKDEYLIAEVGDEEDACRQIRSTLIKNVGMNKIPIIKIHDADFGGNRTLYVVHDHDGRDLQMDHAKKTLEYLFQLWGREVMLETIVDDEKVILTYDHKGVDIDIPNKKKKNKK